MATIAKSDQRGMFLRLLDEAYDHTAWHGPNLKSSVRGVASVEADWRPGSGRRNIAEIVLHCAYYKYVVRRRLTGSKRGGFPLRGSDWFQVPNSLAQSLWREYLSILQHEHVELRAALHAVPSSLLATSRVKDNIVGISFHDIYHAGQIRTIRALRKRGP